MLLTLVFLSILRSFWYYNLAQQLKASLKEGEVILLTSGEKQEGYRESRLEWVDLVGVGPDLSRGWTS